MCDIQLPVGRHHIHRDLFAPAGSKLDCYWHVFLVTFGSFSGDDSTFLNDSFDLRVSLNHEPAYQTKAFWGKHGHNASLPLPLLFAWCSFYTILELLVLNKQYRNKPNRHDTRRNKEYSMQ